MPSLDPTWGPFLAFVGTVVVALLGVIGSRFSARASIRAAEVNNAAELIGEWRELHRVMEEGRKADREEFNRRLTADREEFERRLTADREEFERKLAEERRQRVEGEERLTSQFREVVVNFGLYMDWVREGAEPPAPVVAPWILKLIEDLRGRGHQQK